VADGAGKPSAVATGAGCLAGELPQGLLFAKGSLSAAGGAPFVGRKTSPAGDVVDDMVASDSTIKLRGANACGVLAGSADSPRDGVANGFDAGDACSVPET
jgi:hypothetical protein